MNNLKEGCEERRGLRTDSWGCLTLRGHKRKSLGKESESGMHGDKENLARAELLFFCG